VEANALRRVPRARGILPAALLVLLQVLVRIPAYASAGFFHSDAAVVGLQARHILQGEWSWFLWGANYQASFDSLLTAGAFALFGATPGALMVMPLLGHILMLLFAYAVLCRRLEPGLAWILVLGLSWMPAALDSSLFPPRQWSLTAAMAGVWLLDGAAAARRPWLRHAAAGLLAGLAVYFDLYALQLMVGFCLFAALCAFDPPNGRAAAMRRLAAFAITALIAGLPILHAWDAGDPGSGKVALTLGRVQFNARLLIETCLPRLLGAKLFIPGENLLPDPWDAPLPVQVFLTAGAALFLGGLLSGGVLALRPGVPWPLRRLGALGFVMAASSLGGFLLSIMPWDLWSTRYLAPVTMFAPFALAPVASRLGRVRTALALSPYLVATLASCWLILTPRVHGLLAPVDARSAVREDLQLCDSLRRLGIRHGAAEYWLAYRLAFLCQEDPVVVPLEPQLDHYAPYRRDYLRARVVALIFHPSAPRVKREVIEPQLRKGGSRFSRMEIGPYIVLIWQRPADAV
jgi:hypothetical protein